MTRNEIDTIEFVSHALFGNTDELPKTINLQALLEESKKQAVTGIVASVLPANSENVQLILQSQASVMVNSLRCEKAHCELGELLSKNGINYVILKGCASAAFYPIPAMRSMGDVDFLIHREDQKQVTALLELHGFENEHSDTQHHDVFKRNGITFEMHIEVNGIPKEKGEYIQEYLADTIETSKQYMNG